MSFGWVRIGEGQGRRGGREGEHIGWVREGLITDKKKLNDSSWNLELNMNSCTVS